MQKEIFIKSSSKLILILAVIAIVTLVYLLVASAYDNHIEKNNLVKTAQELSNLGLKQYIEIYPSEEYGEEEFLILWNNGSRNMSMDIHMVRGQPYRDSIETFSFWETSDFEGRPCKTYYLAEGVLILDPEEDYLKFRVYDELNIEKGGSD